MFREQRKLLVSALALCSCCFIFILKRKDQADCPQKFFLIRTDRLAKLICNYNLISERSPQHAVEHQQINPLGTLRVCQVILHRCAKYVCHPNYNILQQMRINCNSSSSDSLSEHIFDCILLK